MKRALSRAFQPPAPMVPVVLRAPAGVDAVAVEAKLDTGADLCAVPERHVAELDLPPVRTVRAAGFVGALHEAIVYRVDITLAGVELARVEALSTKRPYVILGRNVLQRLVLRVDGPREMLEIRFRKT
jgi:predicted aspartyl protease